jgi:TPR repeat protein
MKRILFAMGCLLFGNTFAADQDSGFQFCNVAKHLREEYMKGSRENLPTEIAGLFLEAVNAGSIDALYEYGNCLSNGFGVQENREAAMSCYEAAAMGGHVEAQISYGICLREEGNFSEAMHYLEMAAMQGSQEAQNQLEKTAQLNQLQANTKAALEEWSTRRRSYTGYR